MTRTRIKLIAPIPIPPPGMSTVEQMLEARRRAAGAGTVVDFYNLTEGPLSLGTVADRLASAQAILPEALKAPDEGYDAVIVDCTCDQLYPEVVEKLSVPLVPPLHTSLHLAAMLADRFSLITPTPGQAPFYREQVERYGFKERVVSVREQAVDFMGKQEGEKILMSMLLQEGEAAREEGAQLIVLCCTAITQERRLQELLGIPVLAPGNVAVKSAETLVKLGLYYT